MAVNPAEWERTYDTQVAPLVDQITRICEEHGIPCSLVFQVTAEEDPTYVTTQRPIGASRGFWAWMERWHRTLRTVTAMSEWDLPGPEAKP